MSERQLGAEAHYNGVGVGAAGVADNLQVG